MSWIDGKPQVATDEHIGYHWTGGRPGERFRCYLCGYKFQRGDYWRFVWYDGPLLNFLVCKRCDGKPMTLKKKWEEANREAEQRFWWMRRPD